MRGSGAHERPEEAGAGRVDADAPPPSAHAGAGPVSVTSTWIPRGGVVDQVVVGTPVVEGAPRLDRGRPPARRAPPPTRRSPGSSSPSARATGERAGEPVRLLREAGCRPAGPTSMPRVAAGRGREQGEDGERGGDAGARCHQAPQLGPICKVSALSATSSATRCLPAVDGCPTTAARRAGALPVAAGRLARARAGASARQRARADAADGLEQLVRLPLRRDRAGGAGERARPRRLRHGGARLPVRERRRLLGGPHAQRRLAASGPRHLPERHGGARPLAPRDGAQVRDLHLRRARPSACTRSPAATSTTARTSAHLPHGRSTT